MSGPNTPLPSPRLGDAEAASLRFQRIAAIFEEARQVAPEEREAALLRACGDDGELLVEVRALLAHHEAGMDALDGSVIRPGVGARIGRYRIEGILGEGGMGSVYRAIQLEPVRREVALKVIKLGMDTREVVRRFEAERQALARLEHPHVAKVLDGGATPDGRPYFVMELVRGTPITQFCDERRLEWRERVRLMLDVCAAVHHAHQRGVLHRDLKPSNVLVGEVDGAMLPKIIDFGVAKALEPRDGVTAMTLSTALGHVVGTPEYMSPEQAAGEAVDTRTDVFALGVLLYELLAGVTPVRARSTAGRRTPAPIELRRRLLDCDAPRVSSAIDEPRAALRRSSASALRRALRGELDWIVLKALDRDPERRYASVAALADDLSRLLADEPIAARPPSSTYLLAKFARRHTVALAAAAAVLLSLFVGTGVSLYGLQAAQAERDLARDAEREQARLADALREQLFASDVELGRKAARQGSWTEASQRLWAALERDPASPQARWASRELVWAQGSLGAWSFDSSVRCIRFIPGTRRAFVASQVGQLAILDTETGERTLLDGVSSNVWEVDVSADARWGVTADLDGAIVVWDLSQRSPPRFVHAGAKGLTQVRCEREGTHFYFGGVDGVVWRADFEVPDEPPQPVAVGTAVRRLVMSPDGALAIGRESGAVTILSTEGSTRELVPHDRPIQSIAFGEGGRVMATGTTSPTVVLTDLDTGQTRQTLAPQTGTARDMRFGPDDRSLWILGWWALSEVALGDESVRPLASVPGWRFDVSSDGGVVAIAGASRRVVTAWDISPDRGNSRGVAPARIYARAWPTGYGFLAMGDGTIRALDVRGRSLEETPVDDARPGVRAFRPSGDGARVAVVDAGRHLTILDQRTGSVIARSAAGGVRSDYSTVSFAGPDLVAYATSNNAVRMLDLRDGSDCEVSPPKPSETLAVALNPAGTIVTICGRGGANTLVQIADGRTLECPTESTVFSASFTNDGCQCVVGTWKGDVLVFAPDGQAIATLSGHTARVADVVAHPTDPQVVLTYGDDGTLRVWHLGLLREVTTLRPFATCNIRTAGFSDGGNAIAAVGTDGSLVSYSITFADRIIEQAKGVRESGESIE